MARVGADPAARGQLGAVAAWIRDGLGEMTPWHITRFHPQYQMQDLPATPLATLERAWRIGREAGLKFVYLGNVPGHDLESTVCHSCGQLVVARSGYLADPAGLDGSRCGKCGTEFNFRPKGEGGRDDG